MNFKEIQEIFYRGGYDIKFKKPRNVLIYDTDNVIIKHIDFRGSCLYIYINLDNEYVE